jgi:NAD(P)-dependent dehydrogenase (short-subunit alcohol dehydrogenase family)
MGELVKGKVAVVTGSGGGIGRGIALAMAANGAQVVVNDVSAENAQHVVDEIKAAGGNAVACTDSVSSADSAGKIVQAAVDSFGHIDIIVNNAGILRDRLFHKMSNEEWSQVLDVHLNGSFFVSHAAAPFFRAQESGAYIHMTSTSGLIGNFGQAN